MRDVVFRVRGRVQGVGYRRFAVSKAEEIGEISGWVHNDYDGSVLIAARGDDEKIDALIMACEKGPFWGRVDKLEFVVGRISSFLPPIEDGVFKRV